MFQPHFTMIEINCFQLLKREYLHVVFYDSELNIFYCSSDKTSNLKTSTCEIVKHIFHFFHKPND